MTRSMNRWITTLVVAALLGVPALAAAQTPYPSTPPPQQQPAPQPQPAQPPAQPAPQPTQPPAQPPAQPPTEPQPQPPVQPPTNPQPAQPPTAPPVTTPPSPAQPEPSASPEEHLRQARAAFNDIKMTSIPARSRADFMQLRRHLAALDKPSASSQPTTRRSSRATAATSNWGTEVAAIDKIITNLIGSETSTAMPGATGTAGSRGSAKLAIDDATRAKLMDIRTHITAYAAAKSGAPSTPRSENAPAVEQEPAPPAQAPPAPAPPAPSTVGTSGRMPAQPPESAAPKVDAEAAHRSLLAARDSLNQLTQLPAAAQLTGDVRTQVQQLIANFNELVTNTSDWRASYTKVAGNLTALLGPDNTEAASTEAVPTATTGTTMQLDPAVRAKLVEMRKNLNDFQKASGGINK